MNCAELKTEAALYLSGEMAGARAAEVAEHLKSCPACAMEIKQQADLDAALRAAVLAEPVDTSAVEAHVRHGIQRIRSRGVAWSIAAAAAAVLAISLGVTSYVSRAHAPVVFRDAAADHRVEVVEQAARRWLTDRGAVEKIAARPNVPVPEMAALTSAGFEFKRGKLCRLDNRVFLHLIYSDGRQEFSVFLRQRDGNPLPARAREVVDGHPLCPYNLGREHSVYLETDKVAALIVTDEPGSRALDLARSAARVL